MPRFLRHALACALLASAAPAFAATTTTAPALSSTSFSDLGAGPMYLGAAGGDVVYEISDSQPSIVTSGHVQHPGNSPAPLCGVSAHVWARATVPSGTLAVVSAGSGISCGSGGGGGGGAVTASDGALATIGTTTDTSSANTLVGLLKALNSTASGPIPPQTSHGVNIGAVEGVSGSGATASENPLLNGGRAATTEPTVVTDGQKTALMATKSGKLVIKPYAVPDLDWRGSASTTAATATTLPNSSNSTLKTYVTGLQCSRTDTGTSAITVAIYDTAGTPVLLGTFVLPNSGGGGGNNITFPTPLVTSAANLSVTFTPSTATSTVYCNAQGYFAS